MLKSKKGHRYRVKYDDCDFFKPGEIVIALEEDDCPFCVREKDFKKRGRNLDMREYLYDEIDPLYIDEIEELR